MKTTENQVGGDHYRDQKLQPIEYILANGLGFCEGNVVKYVTRYKAKGGVEDLKKARHYLDFLIESEERLIQEDEEYERSLAVPMQGSHKAQKPEADGDVTLHATYQDKGVVWVCDNPMGCFCDPDSTVFKPSSCEHCRGTT